jgi:hypothetical protein
MISMLFDMNTHFWFKGHSKRHAISTVRPGTGDQLKPNAIRSEHTLSYGPEDAEPDAYNRRIFRFCAGWLERVMQASAEAA